MAEQRQEKRPVIAVTVGRRNQATPRSEIQTVVTGCDVDYIEAVVRAGGIPLLAPTTATRAAVEAMAANTLDRVDALLLTGGGDILSLAYGEEPHPRLNYQDPARDEIEFAFARLAVERGLPVLGVCRGIQVLNVALGGTLFQDIPSQVPQACQHYATPVAATVIHTVEVTRDSLLARVVGPERLPVNSYHHQAVKDLGRGLRVNAVAPDGVIEGVEAADGKLVLAVQFHPEELAANDARMQALFDWLVEAARRR
jgi:gamma-glutamyl-gamma-aminobutyrate hydrolase PuuD